MAKLTNISTEESESYVALLPKLKIIIEEYCESIGFADPEALTIPIVNMKTHFEDLAEAAEHQDAMPDEEYVDEEPKPVQRKKIGNAARLAKLLAEDTPAQTYNPDLYKAVRKARRSGQISDLSYIVKPNQKI